MPQHPGATGPRAAFADTVARLAPLGLVPAVEIVPRSDPSGLWIDTDALARPAEGLLADLLGVFAARGFAPNRKAGAASLLLRLGWASGFAMASHIALRRVPVVRRQALFFTAGTMLAAIRIDEADICGLADDPLAGADDWVAIPDAEALRRRLIAGLADTAEPVVEGCHRWSGFSRRALWSMVVSAWAAQFFGLAEVHGLPGSGLDELRDILALDPRTADAAPDLYLVEAAGVSGACQTRAACCLYFKAERRHFCASCPIIPAEERLARNRDWIARRARPVVARPGAAP